MSERQPMLKVLDLFSGIGGFSLGLERTGGFETVAFCEIEPFCRLVLAKHWPKVPIYEDVRTLSADTLRRDGIADIDVICGGFPCQDISRAGTGAGLAGERSGLWRQYARLIGEVRPRLVLVENVAALLDNGIGTVLGDLASLRYNAEWSVVSACSVGAPHMRQRVFIVAHSNSVNGWSRVRNPTPYEHRTVQVEYGLEGARSRQRARMENPSELYRGANGLSNGMDRNRAVGNSIYPGAAEVIGRLALSVAGA